MSPPYAPEPNVPPSPKKNIDPPLVVFDIFPNIQKESQHRSVYWLTKFWPACKFCMNQIITDPRYSYMLLPWDTLFYLGLSDFRTRESKEHNHSDMGSSRSSGVINLNDRYLFMGLISGVLLLLFIGFILLYLKIRWGNMLRQYHNIPMAGHSMETMLQNLAHYNRGLEHIFVRK